MGVRLGELLQGQGIRQLDSRRFAAAIGTNETLIFDLQLLAVTNTGVPA